MLEQYPYPFKIVARYTIDAEKVAVSYEVTNEGTEDMPFFVGGHPGFKCPLDEGESYDDYELRSISARPPSSVLPFPRRA